MRMHIYVYQVSISLLIPSLSTSWTCDLGDLSTRKKSFVPSLGLLELIQLCEVNVNQVKTSVVLPPNTDVLLGVLKL